MEKEKEIEKETEKARVNANPVDKQSNDFK